MTENDFLYSRKRYYAQARTEDLIFSSKLKQFSELIYVICALQRYGKMDTEEAYEEIKMLWNSLKRTKIRLRVNKHCRVRLSCKISMRIKLVEKQSVFKISS